MALYALSMRSALSHLNTLHNRSVPRYSRALALQGHFNLLARLYEDAALLGERILLEQTSVERSVLWNGIDSLQVMISIQYISSLDSLRRDLTEYEKVAANLAEQLLVSPEGDLSGLSTDEITLLSAQVGELRKRLDERFSSFVVIAQNDLQKRLTSTENDLQVGFIRILAISIFAVIVLWIMLSIMTRRIVRPIQQLSSLTGEVAHGKWEGAPIQIVSNDEVGELARNFEAMRMGLQRTAVSKAFLDRIVDSMGEALFVLSPQWKVVRSNLAARQLLSRPDDFTGVHFTTLFIEGTEILEPLKVGEITDPIELHLRSAEKGAIPVLLTFTPLLSASGQSSGWVGLARDITERKKAQQDLEAQAEELKRSNQELEQFAYVASHDLQEPLRMVASYMQLLEKRYKDKLDDTAREFIYYAVDGASRMKGLINDLLTYSRVGTRAGVAEWVSMEDVLREAMADLSQALKESKAIVTYQNLPMVYCYPRHFTQLLQNLLGNAIKYRSTHPPRIEVGFRFQGPQAVFWVKDNGIGMKKDYLEKIFVIFQRLHTREEYAGTGIGLAICKKIVERGGGRIWAESEENVGSIFFWTWPGVRTITANSVE